MWNPYKRLIGLLPGQQTDVGQVLTTHNDGVTVELLGGSQIRVKGEAAVNDWVYIRGGAIEGPAPDLQGQEIEV